MSFSTLKLYSSTKDNPWKLIPSKLFKIESIADYLATFSPLVINKFKYIKQGLEISIKVVMDEDKTQPISSSGIKYASIQNDNENIAYYFVKRSIWKSPNTMQLDLVMDVLNTYTDGVDYDFKPNTRIIREHKSRFINKGIVVGLYVDQTQAEVGSIVDGSSITLSWWDNQDEVWRTITTGVVSLWNGDDLLFSVNEVSPDYDLIKRTIAANVTSRNVFRVYKDSSNYLEITCYGYNVDYELMRKIDFVSEGINPLLIRDNADNSVSDVYLLNQDWYLLYRNQNNPSESLVNPVECYLIPATLTKVNTGSLVNGAIVPSTLNGSMYYYLNIRYMNNQVTLSNGVSLSPSSFNQPNMLIVKKQANGLLNVVFVYDPVNWNNTYTQTFNDIEYIVLNHFPLYYYASPTQIDLENWIDNIMDRETDYWDEDDTEVYIDNIELLDRTDSKNIKLIKLPYCPYDFLTTGGKLQIVSTQWSYVALTQSSGTTIHVLKLDDLHVKLERTLSAASRNPFSSLSAGNWSPELTDTRKLLASKLESKLFHSEFYAPTFVYDSFSLHVDLERCNISSYIADGVSTNNIKFTMTSTINSKFLFTFASYKADKNAENFYNIIPVARNNEMVLYNVPYINYIRNGFNYDVKAKNISNASNFIGLGLSAASVVTSLALPSIPLKAVGIMASIVGLATSVKTTIVQTIQNENQIKQRIQQAQNQVSSVAGSDDVDLMSEYCDNRLKYYIYKPTENMENLLNDLFYYAGYNSSRMGVPTHNNRVNFDYLECDASLENTGANIPEEIIDEIKNSFKTGVTYIHKTKRDSNKWDIDQTLENWEYELIGG